MKPNPSRLRIALFAAQDQDTFTGARYDALVLAHALAGAGADVTVFATHLPVETRALRPMAPGRVKYVLSDTLRGDLPASRFDYVFLAPGSTFAPDFYEAVFAFAATVRARMVLLNTCSANWYNVFAPQPRDARVWDYARRAVARGGLVLSATDEANRYAQTFYHGIDGVTPQFEVSPPAINSTVADRVGQAAKDGSIVAICQQDGSGPDGEDLLQLDPQLLSGRRFVVVTADEPSLGFVNAIRRRFGAAHDIRLELRTTATDQERLSLLAAAQVMVLPSHFLTSGQLAVEAAYVGTECVGYELPVLRDSTGNTAHIVPRDQPAGLNAALVAALEQPPRIQLLHDAVRDRAEAGAVATRVIEILRRTRDAVPVFTAPVVEAAWAPFADETQDAGITQSPPVPPLLRALARTSAGERLLSFICATSRPVAGVVLEGGAALPLAPHIRALDPLGAWSVAQVSLVLPVQSGDIVTLGLQDAAGVALDTLRLRAATSVPAAAVWVSAHASAKGDDDTSIALTLNAPKAADHIAVSTDGTSWVEAVPNSRGRATVSLDPAQARQNGLIAYLFHSGAPVAALGGLVPLPADDSLIPDETGMEQVLALGAHALEEDAVSSKPELVTEVRISKATYDATKGILEVNGWCLTPEPAFELFLEVSGTAVVAEVSPRTEAREEISQRFPQYQDNMCGWRLRVKLAELPAESVARIVYVSAARHRKHEWPITTDTQDDQAAPVAPGLTIGKCSYSMLRNTCVITGHIKPAPQAPDFRVTTSSGAELTPVYWTLQPPEADGRSQWSLNIPLAGIGDKEQFTVQCAGATATAPVNLEQDSPRRITATRPSVQRGEALLPDSLELSDLITLKHRIAKWAHVEKKAGSVCYFPAFDNAEALASHYHRASWYLTGAQSPICSVTMGVRGDLTPDRSTILPAPDYFGSKNFDDGTLELASLGDAFFRTLAEAEAVMVWRPLPDGLIAFLRRILGNAHVLRVATDDPGAAEYGNYPRVPWLLLPADQKTTLLDQSQARFRDAMQKEREAGKTCGAVFGTGPSLDTAFEFDFGACMSIACNSIVSNDALLDHIRPAFVSAGDAVSHIGVSAYAETFRADLIRAVTTRDIYFLTSASIGYLVMQKHPEIRDRILLCEQGFAGLNADLENVWSLPRFDSTLNIHMLPVAASFADTVYMLGLDGRAPDPEANEDFWAHSKAAQYHDLVDSGHFAHPTFAFNRARSTEERYVASVEDSLAAGEVVGKAFYSLATSYTPAIHARPAPAHCFAPGTPRRLLPVQGPSAPAASHTGKRALVVSQITRRHFSGGRYHVTMLAEALGRFCDEVVVWTNNMPPWSGDLSYSPYHGRVRYWINNWVEEPAGHFDYVIVVPDGARDAQLLIKTYDIARRCDARTAFVNFESPNWFNSLSPDPKSLANADCWFAAACFSDIILSSAETGVPFARDFYKTLFHEPVFAVAPPAINSPIADLVRSENLPREKQITLISRFGDKSAHKNINAIFDLLTPEMEGYTLALIAGTADLPNEQILGEFRARLAAQGLGFKLLYMISDRRKFEEIARSELMVFPSLFEGFGYPPVEAGYMDTPCVAYDLPVLTEFNHDHAHFAPWGDATAFRALISDLLRQPPASRIRTHEPQVRQTATLDAFSRNLQAILEDDPGTRAARRLTPEKFELARTAYSEGCREPHLAYGGLNANELRGLSSRYQTYLQVIDEIDACLRARPESAR